MPLNGPYLPRDEDYVVGIVKEVKFAGYNVDIKSPYDAFISAKDTRTKFALGDIVFGKLKDVDEVNNANLSQAKNLGRGNIVEISSVKIPRVIGKKSSMVNMIVKSTGSEVYVGKNGRIWIGGGDSSLAARAILKIEAEAHIPGLTERISAFLDSEAKK
ncbi:MAG: hypothetical protein NT157_06945 [Candidatus Micrarchaeota archaeon]|nr:hypothetical protein [Candidatus Micrarchaeota archaeon]